MDQTQQVALALPPTFDAYMALKLEALRQLALFHGLIGPARLRRPPGQVSDEQLHEWLTTALNPRRTWWARAAAGFLLEHYRPGWRLSVPRELLGPVVTRRSPEVGQWRIAVLTRDGHQCLRCPATTRLEAHHVVPWADAPELRLIVANGITLCADCHLACHGRERR